MRARLGVLLIVAACSGSKAPPDAYNPNDPKVWLPRLDDPARRAEAISALERICDPSTIPAIGEAWVKEGKTLPGLRAVIALATPTCGDGKGAPSWKAAVPYLARALEDVGEDVATIDVAREAIRAIEVSRDPDGEAALIAFATKTMDPKSRAQEARQEAIRALGTFGGAKAIGALATVLRDRSEPEKTLGAAVLALGEMRRAEALPPLLEALYRHPAIVAKTRRALVMLDADAVTALRAVLRGENAELGAVLAAEKLDQDCGDPDLPEPCQPVGAREALAAIALGDLRDPSAIPDLLAVLDRAPTPASYLFDRPDRYIQDAALLALGRSGDPIAGERVLAVALDAKLPAAIRTSALAAYPRIGDPSAAAKLIALVRNDRDDFAVRDTALLAVAVLGADDATAAFCRAEASRYAKHADGAKSPEHAEGYRQLAQRFEAYAAAIDLVKRCAGDGACLVAALDLSPPDPAQAERALRELGRLGAAARPQLPRVLQALADPDAATRNAALAAIPRIAPRPCPDCVAAIDEAARKAYSSAAFELSDEIAIVGAHLAR
jgi:hypothetical protein